MKIKKLIKAVALAVCLTMTTPVVAPSVGIETVEAASSNVILKKQGEADFQKKGWEFSLDVETKLTIAFTDDTLGKFKLIIRDENTLESVYTKSVDIMFDSAKFVKTLPAGDYKLIIDSENDATEFNFIMSGSATGTYKCQSIKLNKSSVSIEVGDKKELTATVNPSYINVEWLSSDKKIATVNSNGVITGKKAGTATIIAKAGNKKAKCIVKVKQGAKISAPIKKSAKDFGYKNGYYGAMKLIWEAKNKTGKKINYYTCYFNVYDSVGTKLRDDINNSDTVSMRVTGPVAAGDNLIICGTIGYFTTGSKVKITKIKLEYADGTQETIDYGYSTSTINPYL